MGEACGEEPALSTALMAGRPRGARRAALALGLAIAAARTRPARALMEGVVPGDGREAVVLDWDGTQRRVLSADAVGSALGAALPSSRDLYLAAARKHLGPQSAWARGRAPPVLDLGGNVLSPGIDPAPREYKWSTAPAMDPDLPEIRDMQVEETRETALASPSLPAPRLSWFWEDPPFDAAQASIMSRSTRDVLRWGGDGRAGPLPSVGAHTVVVGLRRRLDRLRAARTALTEDSTAVPEAALLLEGLDGAHELDLAFAAERGLLTPGAHRRAINATPVHAIRPTRGAVGCYLSHVTLWREFRARAAPAFVLEDDARLAPGAGAAMRAALLEAPPGWSLILAGTARAAYEPGALAAVPGAPTLRRALANHYGTFAYAVSPEGAAALWRGALPLRMQVDAYVVALAERSWRAELYALLDACRAAAGVGVAAGDASAWFRVAPPLPPWLRDGLCAAEGVRDLVGTPRAQIPANGDQRAAAVRMLGTAAARRLPAPLLAPFRAYARLLAFSPRGQPRGSPSVEELDAGGRAVEVDVRDAVPALRAPLRVFVTAARLASAAGSAAEGFDSDIQTAPPPDYVAARS